MKRQPTTPTAPTAYFTEVSDLTEVRALPSIRHYNRVLVATVRGAATDNDSATASVAFMQPRAQYASRRGKTHTSGGTR